jgi:hypothetical protein
MPVNGLGQRRTAGPDAGLCIPNQTHQILYAQELGSKELLV